MPIPTSSRTEHGKRCVLGRSCRSLMKSAGGRCDKAIYGGGEGGLRR